MVRQINVNVTRPVTRCRCLLHLHYGFEVFQHFKAEMPSCVPAHDGIFLSISVIIARSTQISKGMFYAAFIFNAKHPSIYCQIIDCCQTHDTI